MGEPQLRWRQGLGQMRPRPSGTSMWHPARLAKVPSVLWFMVAWANIGDVVGRPRGAVWGRRRRGIAVGPAQVWKPRCTPSVVHVGPSAGDITTAPRRSDHLAEGIISGPPCPPWASLGKRAGHANHRAWPFDTIVQ